MPHRDPGQRDERHTLAEAGSKAYQPEYDFMVRQLQLLQLVVPIVQMSR
jgi:hypothetical protein